VLDLDQDLFQTLVLGGLLLLLLVSLVMLTTLSGIRKAIEEASARASFTDGGYGSALPQDAPRQAEPAPAQAAAQSWQAESTTPAAAATAAATAGVPLTSQVAPTSQEAMPEEQPFEREGRWWFKRGNELLLYEEQQGQWVPAPEGSLGGAAGGAPTHQTGTISSAFQSITEAEPAAAPQAERQDSGSFWKCPSCGAVNGSTAASCRMCFTARP
jgi:hypothetical protein